MQWLKAAQLAEQEFYVYSKIFRDNVNTSIFLKSCAVLISQYTHLFFGSIQFQLKSLAKIMVHDVVH